MLFKLSSISDPAMWNNLCFPGEIFTTILDKDNFINLPYNSNLRTKYEELKQNIQADLDKRRLNCGNCLKSDIFENMELVDGFGLGPGDSSSRDRCLQIFIYGGENRSRGPSIDIALIHWLFTLLAIDMAKKMHKIASKNNDLKLSIEI